MITVNYKCTKIDLQCGACGAHLNDTGCVSFECGSPVVTCPCCGVRSGFGEKLDNRFREMLAETAATALLDHVRGKKS